MPDDNLVALVLTVAPRKPMVTAGHLGRAVHALLLRLIDRADPDLAHALHAGDGPRPFTCSTLIGGRREDKNSRRFTPDAPAWLRLTGLNTAVSHRLRQIAQQPPAQIELDGHKFVVQGATINGEEHPWAGRTDYETLGAPYLLAQQRAPYRLRLAFASPTTFRSRGRSQPIPMPDWVFGSLLDRWNAFSPVQVADEMRRFAEECMVLSKYRLQTRAVPLKQNVVQMGCVGRAEYVCLNRDKYWVSMANLMAAYAFYSGVGYQTTVGLGQVRREVD